jgi:hypothetical protein
MNVSHFGQNVSDSGNRRSSLRGRPTSARAGIQTDRRAPSGRRACLDRLASLDDRCSANPAWSFPLTHRFSMLQRPRNRLHRARFRVSSNSLRRPKRRGFDWPVPGRRLQIGDAPAPVPCLTDPWSANVISQKIESCRSARTPLSGSSRDPGESGRMTERRWSVDGRAALARRRPGYN